MIHDHFGGLGKIELVHQMGPPKFIIFLPLKLDSALLLISDKNLIYIGEFRLWS